MAGMLGDVRGFIAARIGRDSRSGEDRDGGARTPDATGGDRPRIGRLRRRLELALSGLVLLYAVSVLAAWIALAFFADRVWPATLLLFGPRWIFAVPALVLAPAAWVFGMRWLLVPVALGLVVAVGPVMGLETPSLSSPPGSAPAFRMLTHNVGRQTLDAPGVKALLVETRPDVAVFQEVRVREGDKEARSPVPGYEAHCEYGHCILSRFPIASKDLRSREDVWEKGGAGAIALYELDAPFGKLHVLNVHLETVRQGLEALMDEKFGGIGEMRANTEQRRWESELARDWARRVAPERLVVAGDFNMPVESAIYERYWDDLENAFGEAGWGYGYTKKTRLIGVRIDHVLHGPGIAAERVWVGPETASDHRPVLADLRVLSPEAR